MEKFLKQLLTVLMQNIDMEEVKKQFGEMSTEAMSMLKKQFGEMSMEAISMLREGADEPQAICIDCLSLAYLKSFRQDPNSTIFVGEMSTVIANVITKNPKIDPAIQEILHKQSQEYKIIFAEFGQNDKILQTQFARTADGVIKNQLIKNNGTLVIS